MEHIHTVHLRYSQVVSALRTIHGLEQGVRVYEDGKLSIRRYPLTVAFRMLMAKIKVELHNAHQVLDAYHQGLTPTFVDPETQQPIPETQEHYMFLWHDLLGQMAEPFDAPVCAPEDIPDMPFGMRAHLLPFLGTSNTPEDCGTGLIPANCLEATLDAVQSLEAKVIEGENEAGAVFAEYDEATRWALSYLTAKIHSVLDKLLSDRNEIRGRYRDANFLLPADKAAEVAAAEAELLASTCTLEDMPLVTIPAEALALLQPSEDNLKLLEPFMAPSHV